MEQLSVDAAVIGSGFGGAVAAARLAQAGMSVVILERGRRWEPGDFPRDSTSIDHGWLWSKDRGLYDIRWLDRMVGVQAAGWGGGSLVYGNVFARPPREVFACWPDGDDRDALDPYYDLAAHMLRVRPVGPDPRTGRAPARATAMEDAVSRLHRPAGTVRPLLAVTFAEDPERPTAGECTFAGECMFGCNEGAKNSLDRNYLAVAEEYGAIPRSLCEVDRIERRKSGAFDVGYVDHATGERGTVTARAVFLAAGAVATTELLLRNRDVFRTLPELSQTLGHGFSGNGDFLAFISRPKDELEPGRGPTITTTTIVDCHIGKKKVWFQVQDGAYPAHIDKLVGALNPLRPDASAARPRRPVRSARRGTGTMALLMMGRDSSDGLLTLDHKSEARVAWKNKPNSALYRAEMRAARQTARQLGGRVRVLPSWTFLRTAVTVHNLGGAPIGADRNSGVIDRAGEVHGYPGLYIVDGAGIPASTGVNPSATIVAVAERRVEQAIRNLTGDLDWRAPERQQAGRAEIPEDEAMEAVQQWREVHGHAYDPSPRPVHFREIMHGGATFTELDGTVTERRMQLRLAVEIPDGVRRIGAPAEVAAVTGVAVIGDARVQVNGTLELFPRIGAAHTYMRYDLRYTDGRRCHGRLTGAKENTGGPLTLGRDLTTLPVSIEHSEAGELTVGAGIVRISPVGVIALACSLRGGGRNKAASIGTVLRFGRYFLGTAARRARTRVGGDRE